MSRFLSLETRTAFIFLGAVAVRAAFHNLTRFTADDAFITFRFAENLAHGFGFVYNVGQHVLGTTTPLFTFVLAVLNIGRLPVQVSALVVSLLASGTTAVLLYRMALRLRFTRFALLAPLAYILWPRSLAAETCGMEAALFTALIVAGLFFQMKRQGFYALGCATLATMTRPEGAWLLVLLLAVNLYLDRDRWLALSIVPLLVLVPWFVFSWLYFGSPVPHAITAKLALYSQFGSGSWWTRLVFTMGWNNPAGWIATPLAVYGGLWLYRKQNWGRAAWLWLGGMIMFYTFSHTRLFFWYLTPLYPIYLLFITAGVPAACEQFCLRDRALRAGVGISIAVAVIVLLIGDVKPVKYYRQYQQTLDHVHKAIGLYLWRTADKNATVAAEDIGYMGYYSKLRILDRDGLVSPEAVPYNRDGRYLRFILDYRPDYVVAAEHSPTSPFVRDATFLKEYQQLNRFPIPDDGAYVVFRRR